MRECITAKKGYILTNGEVYGSVIYLAEGISPDSFYEITEKEYAKIEEQEKLNNQQF